MKKINCKWRRTPKNAPKANLAHQTLEAIKKKRGGLTPQLLIIESKKRSAPFHRCFEWNDSKAAAEYRIVQAREILRFLTVEIEAEEEAVYHVRAFVAPSDLGKKSNTSYVAISDVRKSKRQTQIYVQTLMDELKIVRNKIKSFKIFAGVVDAINAIKV